MKKALPKILIIILLAAILGGGIYYMFFMDKELRDLGYSPAEIEKIRAHKIVDKVTTYNPGLIYALTSDEFDENNIDYYIAVRSNSDVTKDINDLAKMYSIDEVRALAEILKPEDLYALVFDEKIENIEQYSAYYLKGYDYKTSIQLANKLKDEYADTLMNLPMLEYNEAVAYLSYAEKGYSASFIEYFYSNYDAEHFVNMKNIGYFPELEELIQRDGFKFENLARYIRHMKAYQTSGAIAIANINDDYDVPSSVNYSSFYDDATEIKVTDPMTVLVNKTRKLPDNYVPRNLKEIAGEYRDSNQPLIEEAQLAFEEMAKAYNNDHETPLISYNAYISYADQEELYNSRAKQLEDNISELDKALGKAGYDEHQTGLAVNITEKGTVIYDFDETDACSWLKEHAAEYGFILRYPEGKQYLTGYRANSYSYRYVGKDAAKVIKAYGYCYEEYYYLFVEQY